MIKKLLTLFVCLCFLLTAFPAMANHGVSYSSLDHHVSCAWDNGKLTSWELGEINRLQIIADRTHRSHDRKHAINTFVRYRDNSHLRYIPRPVVVLHSHPRPVVKIVLHPKRSHRRHHRH